MALWAPDGINTISSGESVAAGEQFATRARVNDFVRLMRTLPDPDPVLRKMGKSVTALKGLLSDAHLESVWSVRTAVVSGSAWQVVPGDNGRREQEAAEMFSSILSGLDVPRIIEEAMDAVAYGYSPLWRADGPWWLIDNIVGKPSQWFAFDQENRLILRTGAVSSEPVPENRFLLVRHRPSYANPYGEKIFSKCFWPVTFKKNGWRWWTVFVEKYGGAFMYGKYPANAGDAYKRELLDALERMVSDAVAVAPEDSDITIESAEGKNSSSTVYGEYIRASNREISKAVLGQTLTTEVDGKGSYAAAKAHDMVREDLAAADRRRVSSAFGRLARIFSAYNFGEEVSPPQFVFEKEEDLKSGRAERDKSLYAIGFRPKRSYIAREYGIPEEDFSVAGESGGEFSTGGGVKTMLEDVIDAPPGPEPEKKPGLLSRLFARRSKEDRQEEDRQHVAEEFGEEKEREGQRAIDEMVDTAAQSIAEAESFDDAFEILASAYPELSFNRVARLVDEIRYAASQVGASGE